MRSFARRKVETSHLPDGADRVQIGAMEKDEIEKRFKENLIRLADERRARDGQMRSFAHFLLDGVMFHT